MKAKEVPERLPFASPLIDRRMAWSPHLANLLTSQARQLGVTNDEGFAFVLSQGMMENMKVC